MKKLLFTALLAVATVLSVSAQSSQKVRFGVEGGFNCSSISTEDTQPMPGFNAGVKLEVGMPDVNKGLYMSFGFKITTKHWKMEDILVGDGLLYDDGYHYYDNDTYNDYYDYDFDDDFDYYVAATAKMKPYYLDIPIHVGYKFNIAPKASMFVEAGPYIDLGLFGKCSFDVAVNDFNLSYEAIDNVFTYEDAMRRLDVGLGAKLGVEFANHYQVSLGYDHGLNKVFKESDGESCMNRNFTVSVAYMF